MTSFNFVPRHAFLVKGSGWHRDRLQAFDQALLAAGPLAHNLVTVSSILPANCKIISSEEGFKLLTPGQITFCVMARQDSDVLGTRAAAAVGLLPGPKDHFGYISEFHALVQDEMEAANKAKELARQMFAVKTGVSEDQISSDKLLDATAIAEVKEAGQWACAVAICVFVL